MPNLTVTQFNGIRNDLGKKYVPSNYFYSASNYNYNDLVGANKALMPEIITNFSSDSDIDLLYEFNFVSSNEVLTKMQLCIHGGNFYTGALSGSPELIATGLALGKYTATVLGNKLFLFNLNSYPLIFDGTKLSQMGAPIASLSGVVSNPNGVYYYAMTFVTSGGEEYTGTISNTITCNNEAINLALPIGYAGTTQRKIYRTEAGGSTLKLLATIADNTTLEYLDTIADGSLGADIIAVNNECPKVAFGRTVYNRLILGVCSQSPQYVWVGDTSVEVIDSATFEDISGVGNESSPVMGIAIDYSLVVIGTEQNIYTMDVSGETPSITATRAFVGVYSGYSMVSIPSTASFPGGVFFISNLKDIRVFNGNFAQPVATSLDNLKTENYAQVIRASLEYAINTSTNIYAQFYDYKYHVIIGNVIFFFDIRVSGWGFLNIQTASYTPSYSVFGIFNSLFYVGQLGASIIEKMYSDTSYRGEVVSGYIQSPQLLPSEELKYIKNISIYYVATGLKEINVTIILDGDASNAITYPIALDYGAFSSTDFNTEDFRTTDDAEDYRVIHTNRRARWVEVKVESDDALKLRGYKLDYDEEAYR